MPDAPRQGFGKRDWRGVGGLDMERQFLRRALAAAAVGAFVSGSWATATTEISVSNFRVEVSALAPGAAPGVSFSSVVGSTSESNSSGFPAPDQHRSSGTGRPFGQVMTSTSFDSASGAAAAIAGDVFGAGASIRTSAYASSGVRQSSGDATIGLVSGTSTAFFKLAPWTIMTISADVLATASSSGDSDLDLADSGMLMAIGDAEGTGPQWAYVNFNAFAFGAFGAVDDTETAVLSLSYRNDTDADILGLFSGYVASFASSGREASAVPEPATAALWLGGLLVASVLARRRGVWRLRGGHPAMK
jgi:hypothetical protein